MFRVLVFLAFVSCVCGLPHVEQKQGGRNNETEKIIGGQLTTIEKHPYQVSLISFHNNGNTTFCGGSIIGEHWILTAAHCLENTTKVIIRVGSTKLHSGGTTYTTKKFWVHPKYNGKTHDYDVAVVMTLRKIVFNSSTVRIITLAAAGSSYAPGTEAIVSGWGLTGQNGSQSETLRDVSLRIVDHSKCAEAWKKVGFKTITSRMLCAGTVGVLKKTSKGDSGGALVLNGEQIGIVSFGSRKIDLIIPEVYCDVGSVRSWIKQTTGI